MRVLRLWSEYAVRLPLWLQKFLIIVCVVFFIVHILACIYWLIKRIDSTSDELSGLSNPP